MADLQNALPLLGGGTLCFGGGFIALIALVALVLRWLYRLGQEENISDEST
jgi:hypothetical protein